jgi:OOP family OmpA-OmpF porin
MSVQLAPSIDLRVQFDFGKATLTREGVEQAAQLCVALQNEELSGKRVVLTGHTDKTGSEEYNLDLSRRRAAAVAGYLVGECGIPRQLVTAIGKGKSELLAPGDSETDHRLNRRVQVSIP